MTNEKTDELAGIAVEDAAKDETGEAAEARGSGSAAAWQNLLDEEVAVKRKRSRKRWVVVFAVAVAVLLASLVGLGVIGYSYLQGQMKYGDVADKADTDGLVIDQDTDLSKVKVDWDALREANPDTVGWVYMPDTPINYPIVQGEDNEHYLYYDFDGEAGWLADYGAIFLDFRNKPKFTDPVNFIYGHHMNDGSMFAVIATLEEQAAFDEHRTAYLLTPQGNYRLRSFSIVHCEATDPIVETTFAKDKDKTKYIQDKMDRSLADAGKVPKAVDMPQVFALATCDSYSSGRDVLFMYVQDTTAQGLEGDIGIKEGKGGTQGFDTDLDAKD